MTKSETLKKENFIKENREILISEISNMSAVKNNVCTLIQAMTIFKTTYMSSKGRTKLHSLLAIEDVYGDGVKKFSFNNEKDLTKNLSTPNQAKNL
tara:strand:+ start:78 stop:365 length:288 start_codon:yes stop_codon:yes gene_type:complete